MCFSYIISGKKPNAVSKSCASYRKKEEVQVVGFPVLSVFGVRQIFRHICIGKVQSLGQRSDALQQELFSKSDRRGKLSRMKKASFLTDAQKSGYFCPLQHHANLSHAASDTRQKIEGLLHFKPRLASSRRAGWEARPLSTKGISQGLQASLGPSVSPGAPRPCAPRCHHLVARSPRASSAQPPALLPPAPSAARG